jgi:3-hydroxybutyryl-CoA dehydrogenase
VTIQKVGVIGAGVIGAGVAQDVATAGHEVVLLDISADILTQAEQSIRVGLRTQRLLQKSRALEPTSVITGRIQPTTDSALLSTVEFVIENVTEKWETKQRLYQSIDAICPDNCIFAANTSAIPITRIASATKREPLVIGVHFMNPPPLKSVVEVILGNHTSRDTLDRTKLFLGTLGKETVLVNDGPGFVANRILMLTINEAIRVFHEGVASVEAIDKIFKSCFGHKMGPLETADLIGLDTVLYSIEVLEESFGDSKYEPCPLLKTMVHDGLLGRKSGQGFYDYDANELQSAGNS